jgi:hypothetical protein
MSSFSVNLIIYKNHFNFSRGSVFSFHSFHRLEDLRLKVIKHAMNTYEGVDTYIHIFLISALLGTE